MINVSELQNKLIILSNLISEYNNNSLNLYKILEDSSIYWDDSVSKQFYIDVEEEKKKVMYSCDELEDFYDIYLYMYNNYSKFAGKIEFNLKNIDKLMSLFDNFISKLEEIISIYQSFNDSLYGNEFLSLAIQEESLKNMKKEILLLKSDNKETLLNLDSLEKEISIKIFKCDIDKMIDRSLREYKVGAVSDKMVMDLVEMSINLRKLVMYKMKIDVNFENIKECIVDINYNYLTDNLEALKDLELRFSNKLKTIGLIYEHYITVINENIEGYTVAKNKVENILNNLG